MPWRGAWLRAQITGLVFSSVVWLIVAGLSLPAAALALMLGAGLLAGRNTRAGLWWRFGARPATGFERDQVLAATVPISSLRGRHQPRIWIGRRLTWIEAIMPTGKDLVVSRSLVGRVISGQLDALQVSALVCHALGQQPVNSSVLVAAVDAYCVPWAAVEIVVGACSRVAVWTPLLSVSWKIRWIVFAVAIIDNALASRWNALIAVTIIAILSGTTPAFRARWRTTLRGLGDERATADGFGPTLAAMIRTGRRVPDLERAAALTPSANRPRPAGTTIGRSGKTR
jgi:hypothetical protein